MVNFQAAQFLTSASTLEQCPPDTGLEVAFAGRSNAGKSSCINALTQHGKLARVSKTPGRTQLINFFTLSEHQRLVDLPGYGYAKVPKELKAHWEKSLERYLRERRSLQGLVLLMDIRHPLQTFDMNMLEWAQGANLAVHVVLTKADKLNRNPALAVLQDSKRKLARFGDLVSVQLFSSPARTGLDELRQQLSAWLETDQAHA